MKSPHPHPARKAVLLLAVLLLALSGCMKEHITPIDAAAAREKLEARHGVFDPEDGAPALPGSETAVERLSFHSDQEGWHGVFLEFAGADEAAACFSAVQDAREITYSRDPGGNYRIVEYLQSDGGAGERWRVTQVEHTILAMGWPASDDQARQAAGKARTALGY